MKRISTTLIVLFTAFYVLAQDHLSFKGIPIEGSMTKFCQKLKAKGLFQVRTDKNPTIFTGNFASQNASIWVYATDDNKNVHAVVVLFDSSGRWKDLVNTYDYCKDLYSRKYGKPICSQEYNPARSDSNIALMAEVHEETILYESAWKVSGGVITLSIKKSSGKLYEGVVSVCYIDDQNNKARIQNDLDDI